MLFYKGNAKINEDVKEFDFQIGTLLGAVKYILSHEEKEKSGLYIFGKKITLKKKNAVKKETNQEITNTSETTGPAELNDAEAVNDPAAGWERVLLQKIKKLIYILENAPKHMEKFLFDVLIKLIRHVFPKEIRGHLTYGFEDPSSTGKLLGLLAMVYPAFKGKFEVTPVWNQSIIDAETDFKGRLHLTYIIYQLLRVVLNKDYKTLRSIIDGRENQ